MDTQDFFMEATTFFMIGNRLEYLLAFLNSDLCEWYFDKICATSGTGTRRWKKIYLELIPIPLVDNILYEAFKEKVKLSQEYRTKNNKASIDLLKEIEEIILNLFDFTLLEIKYLKSLYD